LGQARNLRLIIRPSLRRSGHKPTGISSWGVLIGTLDSHLEALSAKHLDSWIYRPVFSGSR